ncbi:T9SS type A sorting domain-containing protein, partial [bacterium]|nr:T9SS type A sorting domain-containing protein [bacterium]
LADGLYGWGMIASATDLSGTTLHASKQFFSFSIGNPIAVSEKTNPPKDFVLEQNHPNPFNPSTTISYEFKNSEKAKLLIFNVLGEKVMDFSLEKPKGSVVWNGKDASGNAVSSGVYFYKLETGNFSETKKMLFLK